MIRKLLYPKRTIIKRILKPFYSYFGYKVFNLVEWLTGYKIEKYRAYKAIGYYPDLRHPQSFNEKIIWKKLYDRNPLLPIVSDKYKVRKYLKEVLGEKEAEKILVPLYYVTDKPDTIPFETLPQEYVIKPNHASGKVILAENIKNQKQYRIVEDYNTCILYNNTQNRREIIKVCKDWLSISHGFDKHEWAYQKIERKIIIEKLLRDTSGKTPVNYDFLVFHGKCHFIVVFHGRFDEPSIDIYTSDWQYLNVKCKKKKTGYEKKPVKLIYMIELAELLGKPFDFIRVDFYIVDNGIYFSELTNYPASGRVFFNPESFDFELGSKWTLVPNYWK